MLRKIIAHIALFLAIIIILSALLALAAAIPNEKLEENFMKSAMSYSKVDSFVFGDGTKLWGVGDNYADCVLLAVAYQMGIDGAIDTKYYDGESLGVNAGFYLMLAADAEPNTDYTRYWHGGAMLLRPLLLFCDISAIKLLGFVFIMLFAALGAAYLIKKGHWEIAVALSVSMTAVQIWNLRLSIEYQSSFLITFMMLPIWIFFEKREKVLTYLALAAGTAVAFFDFLTTETVTILLPLIVIMAIRLRERRLEGSFMTALRCGSVWLGAYAATFLAKWTLATIITGKNCFALAFSFAETRFVGESGGFLSGILSNFSTIFGGSARLEAVRIIVGLLLAALIFGSAVYLRGGLARGAWLLPLTGSVVILRFAVLNNHSYLHEFFTYRALICLIFALLVILIPERRGRKRK